MSERLAYLASLAMAALTVIALTVALVSVSRRDPPPLACPSCAPCLPSLALPPLYTLPEDYSHDSPTRAPSPPPGAGHDALTDWLEERARPGGGTL